MKKTLIGMASAVAVVASAACSSSSSGGGSKTLASGSYTVSNASTTTDDCQIGDISSLDGQAITVTVSGTDVSLPDLGLDLTLTGTSLAASDTFDIDWTDSASSGLSMSYNCQEHDTYDYSGSVTGKNKFSLAGDIQYTMASGTAPDCIAANNSEYGLTLTAFPCESTFGFDAAL